HGHRGPPGGLLGGRPQGRLWLDREDTGHGRGVVLEVDTVARADLDHSPAQAFQQAAAMVVGAALIGTRRSLHVHLGEARLADGGGAHDAPWVAREASPSTSTPSALENRSGGTAFAPCSMWWAHRPTPSASMTTASCSGGIGSASA